MPRSLSHALALVLLLTLSACQRADTPSSTPASPPGDLATLQAAAAPTAIPSLPLAEGRGESPTSATASPPPVATPSSLPPLAANPSSIPPLAAPTSLPPLAGAPTPLPPLTGAPTPLPPLAGGPRGVLDLAQTLMADGDTDAALTELTRFVQDKPQDPGVPAALFMLGRLHFDAGHWDEAVAAYERYVSLNGPLADYAQNRVGNAHFSARRYDEAARAYQAAVRRPDVTAPVQRAAWHGLGDARAAQQDWAAARAAYESALAAAPDDEDRAAALWALVQLAQRQGDTATARASLRRLWTDYPRTGPAYQAVTRAADGGEPTLQYGRGLAATYRNDFARAADAFNKAADSDPQHPADTHLFAGTAYRRLGQPTQAVFHYDQLINTHPGDPLTPDAVLGKARAQRRSDPDAARATYTDFLAQYPSHAEAALAALELGQTVEAAADCAAAIPHYQAAAMGTGGFQTRPTVGPDARPAAWDAGAALALCYMEQGNPTAAAAAWQTLAQAPDPARQAQGLYWLAHLASASNPGTGGFETRPPAAASDLYRQAMTAAPGDFYAARAALALNARPTRRLGLDDETGALAWLLAKAGRPAADAAQVEQAIRQDRDIVRARALYEQGLRESAARHVSLARKRLEQDPIALYFLARAINDVGGHNSAMTVVETLAASLNLPLWALPPAIQAQAFPRPYRALVEDAAARHGLDSALMYALMRQESRFEPGVESIAGARGLMQILPATGQSIARSLGRDPISAADLYQPAINIDLGAAFLAQQLQRFDGETWAALAAYNAGPNAVPRWLDAATDPALQIEAIDYPETATYVRRVLSYWAQYAALYG